MRKLLLAATAALVFVTVSGASQAGPLILATVTAKCAGMNANLTTVSVTLNTATMNFYGSTLFYHFKPPAGETILPTPAGSGNPVALFIAPGTYDLQIAPQSTQLTSSSTSSAPYPVTIPSNMYISGPGAGRRMCAMRIGPVLPVPHLVPKAHQ
jgi:hypothetical protein